MQLPIVLDRDSSSLLTDQVVAQVQDSIRQARLAPGQRLPSSRRLAEQLDVARNTVVRAYERLLDEGYVESRASSGYFVSRHALREMAPARAADPAEVPAAMPMPPQAEPAPQAPNQKAHHITIDFSPGRPHSGLFPLKTWRRAIQASLARGGAAGLTQPGDPAGLPALRSAIAAHLAATRGIAAAPERIIVTNGIQQGLHLAAHLFLREGCTAMTETPGYAGAAEAFLAAGATLVDIETDENGLVVAALPEAAAALLYLTPAHQYPAGHILPDNRRRALVDWARRRGCYIVEDDYDGDLRYEGSPSPALAAIAPDCVIHLGTFSQTLGAGLRLGYMAVPAPLAAAFANAKGLLDRGNSWLDQAALAELIRHGSYAAHLARVRTRYRESRDALVRALRRYFGIPTISGEKVGLQLLWHLPPGLPDAAVIEVLGRRAGVGVFSLAAANVACPLGSPLRRRALLLGFAGLTPKQIDQGIMRLSDAIDDAVDDHLVPADDLFGTPQDRSGGAAQLVPNSRQQPALRIIARRPFNSNATDSRGTHTIMAEVTGLYRYPIKGLSPQPVARAAFEQGRPLPMDRIFALARPGAPVDLANPQWAKKGLFIMLMLEEELACVKTTLDVETMQLRILDGNEELFRANLDTEAGRHDVEAFFQSLVPSLKEPPRLVRSSAGHFMDKPDNVVSLINLATVRSLESQWGYAIDPLRFRANIYVDGLEPWEEFSLVDQTITIGDAAFRVDRRNGRCSATNVNPVNGKRDLNIPGALRASFGHKDLGVYLVATSSGSIAVGDHLTAAEGTGATAHAVAAGRVRGADRPRFICRGCYYIYAESDGALNDGIAPGTPFLALPADWRCPDCGTDKSKFQLYAG